MGCKRLLVRIGKEMFDELKPTGVKLIREITQIVATTGWANEEKRDRGYDLARGVLKSAGIEAHESTIRGFQEIIVRGMTTLGDDINQIGVLVEAEDHELTAIEI